MVLDGLTDAFNQYHMGITAENVAKEFNISRQDQDAFALQSQLKAKAAIDGQFFDQEIVPVEVKAKRGQVVVVSKDEHPKPGTDIESLAKLRHVLLYYWIFLLSQAYLDLDFKLLIFIKNYVFSKKS